MQKDSVADIQFIFQTNPLYASFFRIPYGKRIFRDFQNYGSLLTQYGVVVNDNC